MRHRLGRFTPQPGSSLYAPLLLDPRFGPLITQALQENLGIPLSPPPASSTSGQGAGAAVPDAEAPRLLDAWNAIGQAAGRTLKPGPDLLASLPNSDPDRPWVAAVHRRLVKLSRRFELRLLACEREPGASGFVAIAATTPGLAKDVRPGDTVWGGFVALREADHPVRIRTRIFRVVCQNGSLVWVGEGEIEPGDAGVEEQVERCFDPVRFASAVEALREGAGERLDDPASKLDEMRSLLHRGLIEQRWREEKDRTVYGLINTVTSVARDLPDMRERLDLEEMAGSLAPLSPRPRARRPDPVAEMIPAWARMRFKRGRL